MTHLVAADGAKFRGMIEKREEAFCARYEVSLDEGAEPELEIDLRLFSTEISARQWLDAAAAARGFTAYDVSRS